MNLGKTLFAQLIMDLLPEKSFHRIVDRHGGDRRACRIRQQSDRPSRRKLRPAGERAYGSSALGVRSHLQAALTHSNCGAYSGTNSRNRNFSSFDVAGAGALSQRSRRCCQSSPGAASACATRSLSCGVGSVHSLSVSSSS